MSARAFVVGDVVRYTSERESRWCREGMAVAEILSGRLVLRDTYWGLRSQDDHFLTDAEMLTAVVEFSLNDYDELDQYSGASRSTWEKYAPADRQRISAQHGLQFRWFIREGAVEDLPTQIENAKKCVERARLAVEAADRDLAWERQKLADLESQVVAVSS